MVPMPFSPSPAAAISELPVCGCTKVKEPHKHGDRGMYTYHRCRCTLCKQSNTEYSRQAREHRQRREMMDADLVRVRIAKLRSAGLTVAEMADMCGMSPKVLDFAINGRQGRKPKMVLASTFRALNAISSKDIAALERPGGRKVDGDIPRRQVQSLYSFGWSSSAIGERIGFTRHTVKSLLAGHNVTESVRAAIDTLHAETHGTLPPLNTPAARAAATAARNRALANGWTADTATDHEYARYSRAH